MLVIIGYACYDSDLSYREDNNSSNHESVKDRSMDPCFTSHILETCVEIRSIGGEVCTKTGDGFNTKIDQYIRSWQWRWENALCPDLMKKTAEVYMHNDQ